MLEGASEIVQNIKESLISGTSDDTKSTKKARSKDVGIQVKVKKVNPNANLPIKMTPGSSGFDLYAAETWRMMPFERRRVATGIALELPEGYEAQVRSRSGMADRDGIIVLNSPGTIDSDYRGEIEVILYNADSYNEFVVAEGDRIAQLVIQQVPKITLVETEFLTETERGELGFGSTDGIL